MSKQIGKISTLLLIALVFAGLYSNALSQDFSVKTQTGMALLREGEADWTPLEKDSAIVPGAEIRVMEEERLELTSDIGDLVISGAGRFYLTENEDDRPGVLLEFGHMAFKSNGKYENKEDRRFEIKTPLCTVRGGDAIFSVVTDGENFVELASGNGSACMIVDDDLSECVSEGWTVAYSNETGELQKFEKIAPAVGRLWADLSWRIVANKPKLVILEPKEGQYFSDPNIRVVGKTSADARVMVNNTEIQVGGDGGFTGKVSLYEGENTIVVQAMNYASEKITETRKVFLDTIPPILTISQPLDNFDPTTLGNCDSSYCSIQIFGLTEPGVTLKINDIDASRYVEDDGSFIIQDFPVRHDEDTLRVEVRDRIGQRAFDILHIQPPSDMDGDGMPDVYDACPMDPSCY